MASKGEQVRSWEAMRDTAVDRNGVIDNQVSGLRDAQRAESAAALGQVAVQNAQE